MKKALLIRADANSNIGIGHVMRCLALAQAWSDSGGRATFVMATECPSLEARLRLEGAEVTRVSARPGTDDDAIQTAKRACQVNASWVVVDGYHFGFGYQRVIKDHGLHVLAIDDNGHAEHYCADIVLNQNPHAHRDMYAKKEPYTHLLLGTRYVLLRREFLKWKRWKREVPSVARKVLVTLGGSDPDNMIIKVVEALQEVKVGGLECFVTFGASDSQIEKLQSIAGDFGSTLHLDSNLANMPELMAWADVCVAGAGTTSLELAYMGLPSLLIVLANNQRPVAEGLDAMGVAVNLGSVKTLSSTEIAKRLSWLIQNVTSRAEMARRGTTLVDGGGVFRVLRQVLGEMIRLRPAKEKDCRQVWEWANEPEVREVSFSQNPIPWDGHVRWFKAKINDPNHIFWIAEDSEGHPVGQVRYDIVGSEAIVFVTLDRRFRGLGYGRAILWLSSQELFDRTKVQIIHAYVKPENQASKRAFVYAWYRPKGLTVVQGHPAIHFMLQKEEGM